MNPVCQAQSGLILRFSENGLRLDFGVELGEAVFAQVMNQFGVVRDARLLLVHRGDVEEDAEFRVAGQLGVLHCVPFAFHIPILSILSAFYNPYRHLICLDSTIETGSQFLKNHINSQITLDAEPGG